MATNQSSLKVFLVDFPGQELPFVTVSASHTTRSFEVLQRTLEKLNNAEDSSLYGVYIGINTDKSSWQQVDVDDFPTKVLDQSRKHYSSMHSNANTSGNVEVIVTKHIATINDHLSTLIGSSNPSQARSINVHDLCLLEELSESIMLNTLSIRFAEGTIYTYIGSILIAINPYHRYPIYNPKYSSDYQNRRLDQLPPHIFAIADDAYNSMLTEKQNQSIIISGESGAGKTESTKFLLHQLMKLSSKLEENSSLELITLAIGPLLEAFGNAQTVANDNSSRFGKFILLKFKENGGYYGASIEKYLLEKSRIVSQATGERNYHVFYYLLNGTSDTLKTKLCLLDTREYHYLGNRSSTSLGDMDMHSEFETLRESLSKLGFSDDLQMRMFAVLSAILHIGNIQFVRDNDADLVHILDTSVIDTLSDLLNVSKETLSAALTSRTSQIRGDYITTPYKLNEAIATRDALSKALYGALFDWIVEKVNGSLAFGLSKEFKGNTIGVLDIFGFEVFQQNSFEQFCINYANEQLQQYFNRHIFKLEQEEYQKEGIQWKSVDFVDNTECLELIAKRPTGLLYLLDEECSLSGTDTSLHAKFDSQHKNSSCYSSPRMKQNNPIFTVLHYASEVTYSIEGFLEKNRDLMRQDVIDVLATSNMDLVRALICPSAADPVSRWHLAFNAVLAVILLKKGISKRNKASVTRGSSFSSTLSANPIKVSGNGSRKGSSEAFEFEHSTPPKTKIGLGLTKVYSVSDTSTGHHQPDSSHRRPSIANLLKKRKQRPVRNRLQAQDDMKSGLTKSHSIPRLKSDEVRSTSGCSKGNTTGTGRRGQLKTVSAQFHLSLIALMEQLERTHPYFIRCIKSNKEKAPMKFDPELVTRQLRYTGIMETVRIRKSGFPIRMTFEDFHNTYKLLIGERQSNLPEQINEFLSSIGFDPSVLQMGQTKVFMRNSEKRFLDEHFRNTIVSKIIRIQQWVRAKLDRCRYLHMKRVVILIQTTARGWLARREYHQMQRKLSAAVVIQSHWRSTMHRQKYLKLREATVIFQAAWKGLVERRRYKQILHQHRLNEELKKNKTSALPLVQLRKKKPILPKPRPKSATVSSVSDEVNAALLDFDLMLEEEMKKTEIKRDSSDNNLVVTNEDPQSPMQSSSTCSITSDSSASLSVPAKVHPALKRNVKDIISQIQRSSVTPSPPPSPCSPPPIVLSKATNVKNIISQIQSSPTSPTPTDKPSPTPPKRTQLSSDRISKFLDTSTEKEPGKLNPVPPNIKRIKSPFLMNDSSNGNAAPLSKHQKHQQSLKRSKSYGDLVQEAEKETSTEDTTELHTPQSQETTGSQDGNRSHDSPGTSLLDSENDEDDQFNDQMHTEGDDLAQISDVFTEDGNMESQLKPNALCRRPLRRAGGPMKRKHIAKRGMIGSLMSTPPPTSENEMKDRDDNQNFNDMLSEDELEVTLMNNEEIRSELRSKSALPAHSQSLNVPNPRVDHRSKGSPRREIKSVGDNYEIEKEDSDSVAESSHGNLVEHSSELTSGVSVDGLYHLNYQIRHSIESGDRSSSNSSPSGDKERFVVSKKRWGKSKSPVKSLKGGPRKEPHPLLSKIQRIGSPVSSGESGTNTPSLGLSPLKHQKTKNNKQGDPNASLQSISSPVGFPSHSFKTSSVARGQVCVVCNNTFSGFLKYGSKCVSCGIVVHKHCQDRAPDCEYVPGQMVKMASEKVTKTVDDLGELAQFFLEKHHMHSQLKETEYCQIDRVFQTSLTEFHLSLLSSYSLNIQESNNSPSNVSLSFEHLVGQFTSIYKSMAQREKMVLSPSDISIGINQIRTFLDEFIKARSVRTRSYSNESKSRPKLLRKKKAEKDSNIKVHKNHRFKLTQFNLVTICDQCCKLILVLQKGEVCEVCSYSCHEGCMKKVNLKCEGRGWRGSGGNTPHNESQTTPTNTQFGVSLSNIQPKNDANIPVSLEKCLSCIESNGLYTQGIYRKSAGGTSRRAVREALEKDPMEADMDNFSLYAVAATVTSFFRELPEPLLTKDLYTEFIRVTEISDSEELLYTVHQIINKLPDVNHDVFERLVFHLARVAQHHSVNKMDPHNLAIIFAPNLLQGHQGLDPQELLSVMPKQTLVLEVIISEQMNKLTDTLKGIRNISSEERRTASRLSKLMSAHNKEGINTSPIRNANIPLPATTPEIGTFEERGIDIGSLESHKPIKKEEEEKKKDESEEEKHQLTAELELLQKERAILTASLPKLEPYSPSSIDTPSLEFPDYSHSKPRPTSSASVMVTPPSDVRGTGKDEFLKRQSLFTGSSPSSDRSASPTPLIIEGQQEPVIISQDSLPDLPSVELLKPLTKYRISKPAAVKRRRPTPHRIHPSNNNMPPADEALLESLSPPAAPHL